jgi:hypothetical protein
MAFYFVSTFAIAQTPTKQVALSFCRLLGLGCPKQAFAKIATPRTPCLSGPVLVADGQFLDGVFGVAAFEFVVFQGR